MNISQAWDEIAERDLRAHEIADGAMFSTLQCACRYQDDAGTVLGFEGEGGEEVDTLAETPGYVREAVEWLLYNHYIELIRDDGIEFVRVLRRPGEDREAKS